MIGSEEGGCNPIPACQVLTRDWSECKPQPACAQQGTRYSCVASGKVTTTATAPPYIMCSVN